MQEWAKRLKQKLDEGADRGLDIAGLGKAVKLRQPSVWQWFNAPPGKKTTEMMTALNAVRAAQYVGTTVEYLMTGKGPSQSSQPDFEILLDAVRVLDASGVEATLDSLRMAYEMALSKRKLATNVLAIDPTSPVPAMEGSDGAIERRGSGAGKDPGRKSRTG